MEAYTNPNLTTWRDDYKMPFPKNSFLESCSAGWSYIFVPALLCLWSWWHEGCSSSTFSQRTRTLMCLSCLLSLAYWPSYYYSWRDFHYIPAIPRLFTTLYPYSSRQIYDYPNLYYTSNPPNLHWSRYPHENLQKPHDVGMTQPFLTAYATTSPAHVGPLGVTALAGRATCTFFLPLTFTTGFASPDIHWPSQASMSRRQS